MNWSSLIPRTQASHRRFAVACVLAPSGFAVVANVGDAGGAELRGLLEPWSLAFALVFAFAYAGLQLATGDVTGRAPGQLDERERSLGDAAHRVSYRVALVVATLTVALVLVKVQDAQPVLFDSALAAIAVAGLALLAALPALVLAWLRPGEPDVGAAETGAELRRDVVLGVTAGAIIVLSLLVDLDRTVVAVLLVALLISSVAVTALARRTQL